MQDSLGNAGRQDETAADFAELRRQMVDEQLREHGISDERVLVTIRRCTDLPGSTNNCESRTWAGLPSCR